MTGTRERAARDAGFTLVEMLVGLALLAMVVALLPAALRLAADAWLVERRLEQEQATRLALAVVTERLAQALPASGQETDPGASPGFAGDHTSLAFAAPSASGPAGAGVYVWLLRPASAPAAEARGLALVIAPRHTGADPAAGTETRRLLPAWATVRLRYFGPPPRDGEPAAWHDEWARGGRLPLLVEITVTTAAAGPVQRRLVAPRAATPAE